MGLIEWLTSDWTTVASKEMFRCVDRSRTNSVGHVQKTVTLEHYTDARVQKHDDRDEYRIVLGSMTDENVRHGIVCDDIPSVIGAEDGWGLPHTLYDVEYMKEKYDTEEVIE